MPAQRTEAGRGGILGTGGLGGELGSKEPLRIKARVSSSSSHLTGAGSAKTTEAPVSGTWEATVPMAPREDCCRR